MAQALYRRYRSKNLAEIVGQEHITRTLENAIARGAVSHAYLLTGPRGVGKTSIARILAHQINELPYESERAHLDIIEIDAASNRRIDEIRDLRDKVHSAPTSAKYKVYIIDEVHMLTREAFNALLKTLEEPPKHVIFVLATTDVHKLPDTIVSRTQHFTFKPIAEKVVAKHLAHIAKSENIKIQPKALSLIARHGGGSFRDSISLLEQAAGISDDISLEDVQLMLGIPPEEQIAALITAFQAGRVPQVVSTLEELFARGYLAEQIASELAKELRGELVAGQSPDPARSTRVIKELIEVPASKEPASLLEIILLSHITAVTPATPMRPAPANASATAQSQPPDGPADPKPAPTAELTGEPATSEKSKKKPAAKKGGATIDEAAWERVLASLKQSHSTLYSIARMATYRCEGSDITLIFKFPFHQKRLETAKNKQIISDLLAEECGPGISLTSVVEPKATASKRASKIKETPADDSPLETISNIFGGGEMLES